ncbi:LemA family protein [bacterium]|nr:LemA family protein [bacterium]MBU1065302.1 LemA family protein [bacterium]MBU1634231.1 LemA family protein [bacterium]MBU1872592.1 LemA family protein [bacterium]
MKKGWIVLIVVLVVLVMIYGFFKNNYNALVFLEEKVNESWAQVGNQYQRRADLIPNLVETVKGYAAHEKETFAAVTEARAKVGQLTVTPEVLNNPEAFSRFQQVQGEISSVLTRLMAVSENYPQLKANENFLALQSQLEGTENRIAVERKRFNQAVQGYNTTIRRFPMNMLAGMFGFEKKLYFEAQPGAETAPAVEF